MAKQFDMVCGKFGAPMGRGAYGEPTGEEGKISLFRVILDQGYDDGGAYWGCATSYRDQLYCARDNMNYRAFTRASSREEARDKLGIPMGVLKRTTKGKSHAG